MLKDFYNSVLERGFLHQCTDEKGIKEILSKEIPAEGRRGRSLSDHESPKKTMGAEDVRGRSAEDKRTRFRSWCPVVRSASANDDDDYGNADDDDDDANLME